MSTAEHQLLSLWNPYCQLFKSRLSYTVAYLGISLYIQNANLHNKKDAEDAKNTYKVMSHPSKERGVANRHADMQSFSA